MNFIMIGLLLREALDRLCVRLNMYLVVLIFYVGVICRVEFICPFSLLGICYACIIGLLGTVAISERLKCKWAFKESV